MNVEKVNQLLASVWEREAGSLAKRVRRKGSDESCVAWDVSFGDDPEHGGGALEPRGVLHWGMYRREWTMPVDASEESMLSVLDVMFTLVVRDVNADLWTGTGTSATGSPCIVGLVGAPGTWNGALAASGSYAGISSVDHPEWCANVLTNGGTPRPLTFALLCQLERQIYVNSGRRPSAIFTGPDVLRAYGSLFDGANEARTWRDIPVFGDSCASTGTVLMLDEEYIELDHVGGSLAQLYQLDPKAGTRKRVIETCAQLKVKRVNAQGLLGDVRVS